MNVTFHGRNLSFEIRKSNLTWPNMNFHHKEKGETSQNHKSLKKSLDTVTFHKFQFQSQKVKHDQNSSQRKGETLQNHKSLKKGLDIVTFHGRNLSFEIRKSNLT